MERIKNSIISKILIYQLIAYLIFTYPINALAQQSKVKRVQDYIAVLDLQVKKGVPEEAKDALTERLQTEIINSRKYKVVDRAHRDQILKEQGFQLKDCVSSECVVEAGQLLGVGKIVTGSVSKLGESYYINTQLINIGTGVVEASADNKCSKCKLDELIDVAGVTGKRLMGLIEITPPTKNLCGNLGFNIPKAQIEQANEECGIKTLITERNECCQMYELEIKPEKSKLTKENDPCAKKAGMFMKPCFDMKFKEGKYKEFDIETWEQYEKARTWGLPETWPAPKQLTEENDPCRKDAGMFMKDCFNEELEAGRYKEFGIETWEQYKEIRTW